jgi:large subunit ribosomal protein L35
MTMKKVKKYKLKTKKAAAKRFKLTGSGKIRRYKRGKRHLNEHLSSNSIRSKKGSVGVSKSDIAKLKSLLPHMDIKE